MVVGSKSTRYAALHEAAVVTAQTAWTQLPPPPPPPPQGTENQVMVETLLHPNLLHPPQIT